MPGVNKMGYFYDQYSDEIAAFGLGVLANTPHGRKAILELTKAAVVYRTEQVKIIGKYAATEAGLRVGQMRGPAKAAAVGTVRGLTRVAKHPAALVIAGGYIAGSAVGSTHVVETRGDPNPLLMGVF
jgi:hypothetical protein